LLTGLLLPSGDVFELDRIHEEVPDRLSRRHDVAGEHWVTILQDRQHLEEQQVILLPKLAESDSGALMERPELSHQVIDLILQRELGEEPDGPRFSESFLQSSQVQGRRSRRLRSDRRRILLWRNP